MTDGSLNAGAFIQDTLVIMNGGSPRTLCCQTDGLVRHASVSVQERARLCHPWAVCDTVSQLWMDGRETLIKMLRYSLAPEVSLILNDLKAPVLSVTLMSRSSGAELLGTLSR